jgi:hypothetical protein
LTWPSTTHILPPVLISSILRKSEFTAMTDDSKTMLGWSLGALAFLALLIVLTFAIPGLRKTPVMMAGKKATPKDFFTPEQQKVLLPIGSSKYDPTDPPKNFVLAKNQKDALIAAGYDTCVTTDGFGDQENLMGCFCENAPAARAILDPQISIVQPWNTWSAILGFTPFGILIMIILIWQAAGNQPPQDNLMVNNYFYSLFYAYLAIFLGPASAMFHIGLRNYGGWFDSFSIHLLFGFTLVYNLTRMWMRSGGWVTKSFLGLNAQRWLFLIFFIVSTVIVEIICSPKVAPSMRFWFDLIIGGLALIIQGLVFWARTWHSVPPGGGWWFIGAFIAFGAAVFIWAMSWTACPWCAPRGFQGHAVWHLLCGLGAFFLYM